jgi:hypothetical protein
MPMSEAARAAMSERMKSLNADRLAKKAAEKPKEPGNNPLQEAMAKVPTRGAVTFGDPILPKEQIAEVIPMVQGSYGPPQIIVNVDWHGISMAEAQGLYAHIKAEFEKAGKILNARSMAEKDGYTCYMCKKQFGGRPGMTDYSYRDPDTGLFPRIDLCGELCVIRWHQFRIDQRRDRFIQEAKDASVEQ